MKVKIKNCSSFKLNWYKSLVDSEVEVNPTPIESLYGWVFVSDGLFLLMRDCEIIPDEQPKEFKKGQYVVLMVENIDGACFKSNYLYKQHQDDERLVADLDLEGDANVYPMCLFTIKSSWREALPHEIAAYDKAGRPVDCSNIVDEEWKVGDIIKTRNKYLHIINFTKDDKLIFLDNGSVRIGYGGIDYYKLNGWKKVIPKLKVTQAMLVECYLKVNNLTMDKIDVI